MSIRWIKSQFVRTMVLLAAVFVCGNEASLSQVQSSSDSLCFHAWLSKSDYSQCEPVYLFVSWKNCSGVSAEVPLTTLPSPIVSIQIVDSLDVPIWMNPMDGGTISNLLPPGDSLISYVNLATLVKGEYLALTFCHPPGIYYVVVKPAIASLRPVKIRYSVNRPLFGTDPYTDQIRLINHLIASGDLRAAVDEAISFSNTSIDSRKRGEALRLAAVAMKIADKDSSDSFGTFLRNSMLLIPDEPAAAKMLGYYLESSGESVDIDFLESISESASSSLLEHFVKRRLRSILSHERD